MTTENRVHHTVLVDEQHDQQLSQRIATAREHGERLLAQTDNPQVSSVAVHEHLLQHFDDSLITRNITSPFDVTLTVSGEKYPVFLDTECYRVLSDVIKYLASNFDEDKEG